MILIERNEDEPSSEVARSSIPNWLPRGTTVSPIHWREIHFKSFQSTDLQLSWLSARLMEFSSRSFPFHNFLETWPRWSQGEISHSHTKACKAHLHNYETIKPETTSNQFQLPNFLRQHGPPLDERPKSHCQWAAHSLSEWCKSRSILLPPSDLNRPPLKGPF